MNRLLLTLISGGALFLSPLHSRAEPYELLYGVVSTTQKALQGSRSVKRPLVVDLVDHTLTVPSQVEGYMLTLESEEGEVYTYHMTGTTLEIPQELSGDYQLSITNGSVMYKGIIYIN